MVRVCWIVTSVSLQSMLATSSTWEWTGLQCFVHGCEREATLNHLQPLVCAVLSRLASTPCRGDLNLPLPCRGDPKLPLPCCEDPKLPLPCCGDPKLPLPAVEIQSFHSPVVEIQSFHSLPWRSTGLVVGTPGRLLSVGSSLSFLYCVGWAAGHITGHCAGV